MGYIVVIDPGHGGEEFKGGEFAPYIEKDLDLTLALALRDRLSKFDDVTVYLTRETDIPVELAQRADIAKAYNADLFVSVHFNLSVNHDIYGSEVWLPAQGNYYNQLYPLASILMNNFDAMGLYNRGIKTRLGKTGDNYYAVIKGPVNYGIPAMIVEHCHMDNVNDNWALPQEASQLNAALINFANMDADAIAKSLHLKSTALGLDYSNYSLEYSGRDESMILPDTTAPENNIVKVLEVDSAQGKVTINIYATDSDSWIQYYKYSIDNGQTYTELFPWPRSNKWNKSQPDCEVTINVPKDKDIQLMTYVVNGYDLGKESNVVSVNTADFEEETRDEKLIEEEAAEGETAEPEVDTEVADEGEIDEDSANETAALAGEVEVPAKETDGTELIAVVENYNSTMAATTRFDTMIPLLVGIVIALFALLFGTMVWTFSGRKKHRRSQPRKRTARFDDEDEDAEDTRDNKELREWDDYV